MKKKRTYQDRKRSKHFAQVIKDTLAGKKHPNRGKAWGKPFTKGDPRINKQKKGEPARGKPITNEVKAYLLNEFLAEQPLVRARMRLPHARPADHVKYLDLLAKYSPLSQTLKIEADASDAPGKLTKDQVAAKLAEILGD